MYILLAIVNNRIEIKLKKKKKKKSPTHSSMGDSDRKANRNKDPFRIEKHVRYGLFVCDWLLSSTNKHQFCLLLMETVKGACNLKFELNHLLETKILFKTHNFTRILLVVKCRQVIYKSKESKCNAKISQCFIPVQ